MFLVDVKVRQVDYELRLERHRRNVYINPSSRSQIHDVRRIVVGELENMNWSLLDDDIW